MLESIPIETIELEKQLWACIMKCWTDCVGPQLDNRIAFLPKDSESIIQSLRNITNQMEVLTYLYKKSK